MGKADAEAGGDIVGHVQEKSSGSGFEHGRPERVVLSAMAKV